MKTRRQFSINLWGFFALLALIGTLGQSCGALHTGDIFAVNYIESSGRRNTVGQGSQGIGANHAALPATDERTAVVEDGQPANPGGGVAITMTDVSQAKEIDAQAALDVAKKLKNSEAGPGDAIIDDKDTLSLPDLTKLTPAGQAATAATYALGALPKATAPEKAQVPKVPSDDPLPATPDDAAAETVKKTAREATTTSREPEPPGE
jgi:hypothetical protein